MRQLGRLPDATLASRLVDYLLTVGIKTRVDPDGDGSVVWGVEEDQIARGREILAEFVVNPHNEKYNSAISAAREIRAAQLEQELQRRKNMVNLRSTGFSIPAGKTPLTLLLLGACLLVSVLTNLGHPQLASQQSSLLNKLLISEPPPRPAQIIEIPGLGPLDLAQFREATPTRSLNEVRAGEVWRLFTPIFLHFSIWHLVFNLFTLYDLGRYFEARRGTLQLLLFVLVVAPFSNLVQYWWPWSGGPLFGGMSGVLFGLMGYLWIKSRTDPRSGIFVPGNAVVYAVIFLLLGMTNAIPGMANGCHLGGLLAGMLLGYTPKPFTRG